MTSAEFRKLNGLPPPGADIHENPPRRKVQNPIPKPPQVEALARPDAGKGSGQKRALVSVTSYRCGTLLDRTNLYGGYKSLEDCLVEAGLIEDDSEEAIEVHVCQVRVAHRFQEKTEVTIGYPE